MERWGAFSVVDHKDPIRLAIELLLYDKIVVPTPSDHHGPDWARWERNNWEPEALIKIVGKLKPLALVEEVKWDPDREKAWRVKFEKAKSRIEAVNSEIRRGMEERIDDVKRNMGDRTQGEMEQAIQAAGYAETRNEVIEHLRGQMQGTVAIWNGPVEFYSAYQSRTDFEQLNPEEDAIKQGMERVNFLIQHRLAIPNEPPPVLLDRATKLALDQTFRERRRRLYDYQINLLREKYKPEQILKDLDKLVTEYNASVLADNVNCRWETVFTVMAVAGAALTAWAGFHPAAAAAGYVNLAGAAAAAAPVVWTKLQPRRAVDEKPRIAAGEAMFHQMEGSTGFQFRVIA